uniref:Uncharacterized protein n=1 Tax=Oryza glaberrima TaxID=4538 RepID=I1QMZ9_ORYGL
MAAFVAFTDAVSLLRPQFEAAVAAMWPPASFIVADAFLYWVNESAAVLGVPKMSFFGISAFAQVMRELRNHHGLCAVMEPGDVDDDGYPATLAVPEFPHIRVTLEDLMATFGEPSAVRMMMELDGKLGKAIEESHGLIINRGSLYQVLERACPAQGLAHRPALPCATGICDRRCPALLDGVARREGGCRPACAVHCAWDSRSDPGGATQGSC